ncbi:hypothetical protein AAFF_G00138460 [Aldrovandia affinis]|uniref:Uncharacterized protein n=1 Tax=Aldrovandia affinis TaxID=143900 RepID=A0AAD7X2K9_9TELE|nr:hypothetical protein AAFF_G00138460 [Aldrovandia affinis]
MPQQCKFSGITEHSLYLHKYKYLNLHHSNTGPAVMSLVYKTNLAQGKWLDRSGNHAWRSALGRNGESLVYKTTCLAAFNAEGTYMRTMVIFKGKRLRAEWALPCLVP